MAGFNYLRSQATADRLISKFGQVGAIQRSAPGAGPANDPGPATVTSYSVAIAVLEYSNSEIDGTRIVAERPQRCCGHRTHHAMWMVQGGPRQRPRQPRDQSPPRQPGSAREDQTGPRELGSWTSQEPRASATPAMPHDPH